MIVGIVVTSGYSASGHTRSAVILFDAKDGRCIGSERMDSGHDSVANVAANSVLSRDPYARHTANVRLLMRVEVPNKELVTMLRIYKTAQRK